MSLNTPPLQLQYEEPQPVEGAEFKFVWVIKQFSKLDKHHYSEGFSIEGHKWRVLIYPQGNNVESLSVFVAVADSGSLPDGWSRDARFCIGVINQVDNMRTKRKNVKQQFNAQGTVWGFPSFVPLSEFKDPTKGFLVNDTCIIEVNFETNEKVERKVSSPLPGDPLKPKINMKLSLKILVDKKDNSVVLAESDKDFVDILLSFLTMPLGTIHRLLGKGLSIGCISTLYKSTEKLDNQHFLTDACKTMLLRPLNAAGQYCENLEVNIDDTEARNFFTCESLACCSNASCSYSSVANAKCSCGKLMSYEWDWKKHESNLVDGAFVKGRLKYFITDDLHIMPASTSVLLSLLEKLGKNDGSVLEERIVHVGHEEILKLLMNAMESSIPLTNVFFKNSDTTGTQKSSDINDKTFLLIPKFECTDGDTECKKAIKVNLLLTKHENKVVQMEGGEEIVDLLFSFLTLPLGFIIKSLNKTSNLRCINNLYSSVESLCLQGNDCFKSEECKMMLLQPKLPLFFSGQNQLLKIDEMVPRDRCVRGCYTCFRLKGSVPATKECAHGICLAKFKEVNPKASNDGTEHGGGYAKGPNKFIISHDLHVAPFSPMSTIYNVNKLGVSFSDLVEREVSIREAQALNLLKAALASKSALNCLFSSNTNIKRRKLDI